MKDIDEPNILNYLLVREMEMSEAESIPVATKAMDSEWKQIRDMKCRGVSTAQEYDTVVIPSRSNNNSVYVGRVLPISHEQNNDPVFPVT